MKNILEEINCSNKLEQKLFKKIYSKLLDSSNTSDLSKIIDEEKRYILDESDDYDDFGKIKHIKFLDKVYEALSKAF